MMTKNSKDQETYHYLIVLTGALGDIVRGGIVARHLKLAYPERKIAWLVEEKWKDIISLHTSIDRIFLFKRKKGVTSFLKLSQELRKCQIDTVLDLQRILKSGLLSFLSGGKRRIGVHQKNAKELNWIFQTERNKFISDKCSKINLYQAFLENLNISLPAELDFGFSVNGYMSLLREKFEVARSPFILIVLGSSWASKDWVCEGYSRVIQKLLSRYPYRIALIGDRSQLALAGELCDQIQNERLCSLVSKTSLIDLAGFCSSCLVAFGPDSGPAHLCSAFARPYVTLFGPTDPARVAPYGSERLVCTADIACAGCMRRECPGLDRLCMRLISPELVLSNIEQALEVHSHNT